MERTLIKVVRKESGQQVEISGDNAELLCAAAHILASITETIELPMEMVMPILMVTANEIIRENMGKTMDEPRTDAEKSIDDIFNDIIGGSDV